MLPTSPHEPTVSSSKSAERQQKYKSGYKRAGHTEHTRLVISHTIQRLRTNLEDLDRVVTLD